MGKKYVVRLTEQQLVNLISEQLGSDVIAKFIKNMLSTGGSNTDTPSKDSDINIPVDDKSTSKTSGSVESNWKDVTKQVIDEFEGGYWNHWQCKNHP
jgi:hypothetical protein